MAWWRGIGLILATFAVGLSLAVPAGYMVSAAPGLPFALTICTLDGQVDLDDLPGQPEEHEETRACPFSAAVTGPPPQAGLQLPTQSVAYVAERAPPAVRIAPGRGLAAPPPPSRGPPALVV